MTKRIAYAGDVALGDATVADAVADVGALASSAPAALTSSVATGGDSPTEAEHNAVRTDVSNLRGTVANVVTDLGSLRTTVNALLAAQRDAGQLAG